ncbi:MAG: GNAT family N-acetyltransferase [Chloroflexi bacterium]|nr:GNAT family N-acetyltransferase [Chloroflexota bacterium]MCC6893283.1 GNAT family N-acetyltransferase [Anaerolineae bacterium]
MATETTVSSILIRMATADDLEPLTAFLVPFVEAGKLLPRTFDELRDLLPTLFLAEYEGTIVGCAALEIYSWKLAEVRSLAVSSAMQGRGVGKRLVDACIDRARSANILEVMAITSSDAFFMACGFDYTLPGEKRALFMQLRDL